MKLFAKKIVAWKNNNKDSISKHLNLNYNNVIIIHIDLSSPSLNCSYIAFYAVTLKNF